MERISEQISQKVIDFLQKYRLLQGKNKLLTAFSGGPDSLCLLDILYKLSKEYTFELAAGHLNHNWRAEESMQEAIQAKNYCEDRGIEFYTETLPPELPHTEEEARNRRYEFLNRTAKKSGATAILTGHTKTDQVETVLYRILKGTGLQGLTGIPAIRGQEGFPAIYRPLLEDVCRQQCIKYCEENNLSPGYDPSNYDEKYLRNRIRHSLLPELRTYNNAVDSALLRLSIISGESGEIIAEYTDKLKRKAVKGFDLIYTEEFLKFSKPVKKRILMDFLAKNSIEYTFERVEEVFKFIMEHAGSKSGKTFSIAKDAWLFVSSKEIKIIEHIRSKPSETVLPVLYTGKTVHQELNVSLIIEKWQAGIPKKFPEESKNIVYADLSGIKGELSLRTRRPGDIIRPFGMQEKTKLKKYLINRGIPEHTRDEIPLLVEDKEVLWAAGVGISEKLRVKKVPTHIIKLEKIYK